MLGTIRFLLALGVVASHTRGYQFDLYPDSGIVAVCAFFVLSGYLMPATLEKNYNGQATPYLINRGLRIFPMYWVALGVALVVLQLLPAWRDAYDFGLQSVLQNFILLGLNQWPNDTLYIGPAWTLDIELQYYLMVPLLMALRPNLRLILMVVIAGVGVYLLIHPTGLRAVDRSFLPWSVYFFSGMLLYMKKPKARFFVSGSRLDKELGELAYPLFIFHPIVIQASGLKLSFWPLMLCNMLLSVGVAYVAHALLSPTVARLRRRTVAPVAA